MELENVQKPQNVDNVRNVEPGDNVRNEQPKASVKVKPVKIKSGMKAGCMSRCCGCTG
jgi:tRNA-binding EMAP/Myf-like protein